MLFKIHSSRFHEICLASEKKAGVHCMFFSCRAQAKDTPDKKDTVPSSSPPTLQNGPVWSRTFVLDWVLIILVLCERVPRAAFLYSMVSAWMWMIVAENLLCMRIYMYIDNYFWEAFIIYVEGHKNSIFADKGHSNF